MQKQENEEFNQENTLISSLCIGNFTPHNYKTSLCNQWLTNGTCPKGETCLYAHGTAEIRPRVGELPSTLYKQELCKFWTTGKCAHGDQCNYAHGQSELRTSQNTTDNQQVSNERLNPTLPKMLNVFFPLAYSLPPLSTAEISPSVHLQQNLTKPSIYGNAGTPFLMSNPTPHFSTLTPPLWGQPPQSTATPTTSSIASLIKPNHFSPLTSSVIQSSSFTPNSHLSKQSERHQCLSEQESMTTFNISEQSSQIHRQQQIPDKRPSSPPVTMAKVAMQFESMNMYNPIKEENSLAQPTFNAINEIDFPILRSNFNNKTNDEVLNGKTMPEKCELANKSESFARIAAKTSVENDTIIRCQQKRKQVAEQEMTKQETRFSDRFHFKELDEVTQHKIDKTNVINKTVTRPIKSQQNENNEKHSLLVSNSLPSSKLLTFSSPATITMTPIQHKVEKSICAHGDQFLSLDHGTVITQPAIKSQFEDLFERDPYLNHVIKIQAEMNESIERIKKKETCNQKEVKHETQNNNEETNEENAIIEWQTVISRRRKSSLNVEFLPHQPSPFTDDGYQEGYSGDEEQPGNSNHNFSNFGRSDSPGSGLSQPNDGLNNNAYLDKRHIFYRTHICLFWQAWHDNKGPRCSHGDNCFYAHGQKKLRKLNSQYYKTVLCEKFNNGKECPYGPNCNFAHGESELRKTSSSFSNVTNKDQKKFFSIAKRYQVRKQRGIQTIQCTPSIAKHFDKVTLVKSAKDEIQCNKK